MDIDTSYIKATSRNLEETAADVSSAFQYLDRHLGSFSAWGDGRLIGTVLSAHPTFLEITEDKLQKVRDLLVGSSFSVDDAAKRFDTAEDDALVAVNDLFRDLDAAANTPPLTYDAKTASGQAARPSSGLSEPIGLTEALALLPEWEKKVLDILNWPQYLSISWWMRKAINMLAHDFLPCHIDGDIFQWLYEQIGGDWDNVFRAGVAFDEIGKYFERAGEGVRAEAEWMFQGWSSCDSASIAGEFFAEFASVLEGQAQAYHELSVKYIDAAAATYFFCQALYSFIDGLVDQLVAEWFLDITGSDILVTIFSGGTTAPATTPTGIVTLCISVAEFAAGQWAEDLALAEAIAGTGLMIYSAVDTPDLNAVPILGG